MDQRDSNTEGSKQSDHSNGTSSQSNGSSSESNGASSQSDIQSYQQILEQRTAEVNADLDYHRTFLARFLIVVSRGQPEAVERLLRTIRSGASHEQIFQTLTELGADISLESNTRQ